MKKFEVPQGLAERIAERRGRLHAYESFDPARTAFVVVDMQNYFMAEGELAYCPGATDIVPDVNRLARAVRETGGLVVWIVMEASEESRENWKSFHETYLPELREIRFTSLGAEGEGFKLWPGLITEAADKTVVKTRYSAFIEGSSEIEKVLHRHDIETVLIGGVATNVCCDSTARDCMMRGFRTIMVSDANATFSEAEHAAALTTFITFFGDVQETGDVIERLNAGRGKAAAE
jgi:nicotinamidase-related amidase